MSSGYSAVISQGIEKLHAEVGKCFEGFMRSQVQTAQVKIKMCLIVNMLKQLSTVCPPICL